MKGPGASAARHCRGVGKCTFTASEKLFGHEREVELRFADAKNPDNSIRTRYARRSNALQFYA